MRPDVLYLELHLAMLASVLLHTIHNVKRLFRLDVTRLRTLSEGNAIHHIVRLAIHQLQLDVFLLATDHLAGAIVKHILCTEHRLGIIRI